MEGGREGGKEGGREREDGTVEKGSDRRELEEVNYNRL